MSGYTSGPPTLAGFTSFLQNVVQINVAYLPPTAPIIGYALSVAQAIVNQLLQCAPGGIYNLAVYNLGASQIINFAEDQPGFTYFADRRKSYGILNFAAGVVASTADASTSVSLLNPDFMKQLTLQDLQNMKDPYGRQYIAFAQAYGPTIVGLS